MAKQKYYAYLIGKDKGITDNWPECQEMVAGKNGAKYKGFESQAAAAAMTGISVRRIEYVSQASLQRPNAIGAHAQTH